MTTLNPKEIFQLELFISPLYLSELRDTWGEMINHLERCLDEYLHNLPLNYRKQPLPEQPDAVWGERILPNFRNTYQSLCSGVIALTHGDLASLRVANGPLNDYKGQREFSSEWLRKPYADRYFELLNNAHTLALNICATEEPYWRPGDLLERPAARGNIDFPADLPEYRLNQNVKAATGDAVQHAGIYAPDLDGSCPQYLSTYKKAPKAIVLRGVEPLLHPTTGEKYAEQPIYEKVPCSWTLVERIPDKIMTKPKNLMTEVNRRMAGGDTCPESGYYFTPSRTNSRCFFERGTVMPTYHSEYGATIWQWDSQQ